MPLLGRRATLSPGQLLCAAGVGLVLASGAQAQTQPSPNNLPRFQSTWQEVIKPNGGFFSSGVAQEFAYTAGPSGVTSVAPPSTNLIANVRQIYDAQGRMSYFDILDGIRSVSFVRASTDTFTPIATDRAVYLRASDWTRQAVVADPQSLGWQYQSFAAWQTGLGQPNGSMGATSFGNETGWNGSTAVPQTGQATFTGFMGAIYNDAVGQDHVLTADVGIQMNFGAHTADFATTNTKDRYGAAYDELNVTGTFVGLPNFPQMFGSLTTARLQGTSSARFFGPAAEEFGGVFTLTPKDGQGLERMAGAFGSRQGEPATPSRFTTWGQALQPNATVFLNGVSAGFRFRGSSQPTFSDNNSSFSMELDGAKTVKVLRLPFGAGFGADSPGTTIAPHAADRRFISANTPQYGYSALIADPVQFGWDYQTFGAWANAEGYVTGFSGGAATPNDALPPTGEVTFKGTASAFYEPSSGEGRTYATANVTVGANFANRTADFRTTDMVRIGDGTAIGGTALSSALAWTTGANALSGAVSTADNRMTGVINGRFYGPQAQELGGSFALRGADARLTGAFGAKR